MIAYINIVMRKVDTIVLVSIYWQRKWQQSEKSNIAANQTTMVSWRPDANIMVIVINNTDTNTSISCFVTTADK